MTNINIKDAIHIWTTDTGYRTINSYLLGNKYKRTYPFFISNNKTVNYDNVDYKTKDIIYTIEQNMTSERSL